MSERKESVDSFDEFFGVPKTDNNKRKSSIASKQNDTSISAIVKTQPIVERSPTPTPTTTPEERRLSSPSLNPKVNNAKTPSTTNGYKNITPETSNRAESVQSKAYESDFDNDNGFDDDETVVESIQERNKTHGSLPPTQQRIYEVPRRGSDSELKSSFTTTNHKKSTNRNIRRNESFLPSIRPQQTRRTGGYPIHRRKENLSSSSPKTEIEQRALAAQNHKIKTLESRLAELRRELEVQRVENATLRTIQRREEKAIKKYEEKEFDIHRVVRDYAHEIDYMKEVLSNERAVKIKLEKQIEVREEKLRDQTNRMKNYEKIVKEKNLDERYELREKLNETDKKLQEVQEKLNNQEKYIENLEKNHRHEVSHEIIKQRELKRRLEEHSQKYNDLLLKFEDKTRQIDTMHIYVQRGGKRRSDSPTNLSKSRSLQSLQETSSHSREKTNNYDKKRREQQEQEKKSKSQQQQQQQQRSSSNDSSPKHEKKKIITPKKSLQNTMTTTKNLSNDEKSSTIQNDHLPPKGKPPTRRLSTPKSVDEDKNELDNEDIFGSKPKKLPPPTTIQRSEQHLSHTQLHKRPIAPIPPANESKYSSSGTGGNTSSSIFKLTEPPMPSKSRTTRQLDEKWSDMFGSNEKEDSAKEDLLAKLVADEQQERRQAATAAQSSSTKNSSMTMFESSTRSTVTTQPTTTIKPSADPFESLFSNNSNKSTTNRKNDSDDIFSTKPSNQSTTQTKNDPFESLFAPSSTANNSTTINSNSRQYTSQNDKLQRPKIVTNPPRSIPNRTVVDEVEEFVL
ncbi:unnamed protein product [Rotaria sordida]|uniref:Lebercilin domain-containing protein n=1 Tax=Rotaria sordida TaxID=392033 RepID=A0A813ZTN2_9BILA|nr:unnamed protein product [Rotaria sordida]CAF1290204.1 unnamed protein product [Rotaria sordida]